MVELILPCVLENWVGLLLKSSAVGSGGLSLAPLALDVYGDVHCVGGENKGTSQYRSDGMFLQLFLQLPSPSTLRVAT